MDNLLSPNGEVGVFSPIPAQVKQLSILVGLRIQSNLMEHLRDGGFLKATEIWWKI